MEIPRAEWTRIYHYNSFALRMADSTRKEPHMETPRLATWPQRALFLAVVVSPWTSYLALSSWVRLPVLVLGLAYLACAPGLITGFIRQPLRLFQDREDLLLALFMSLLLVSYGLGFGGPRSFNHTLSYCFTFLFYLFLFKLAARQAGFGPWHMARAFAWSALLGCFMVLLDSVLVNFFDFRLRPYLLTGGSKTYNMLYFSKGAMQAVGGTAEEPGSMAFFLNIIAPIGLWYFHRGGRKGSLYLLGAFYLLSMVALRSTAGLLITLGGAGVAALLHPRYFASLASRLALLLFPIAWYAFVKLQEVLAGISMPFLLEVSEKMSMSTRAHSAAVRADNWDRGMRYFLESPWFGTGPGFGKEINDNGYTQFFLTVLADTGILTFACICLFLIAVAVKVPRLPNMACSFLILPFFGSIVHLNIIGDYWSAPFWFAIVMVQLLFADALRYQRGLPPVHPVPRLT